MMATTSSMHWPLSRLLAGFAQVSEELNVEVSGISQTHLDAHAGDLFLALAGKKVHGMQFCKDLEAIGVAAIGWEPAPHFDITTQQLPNGLTCVRIENLSSRLGELAATDTNKVEGPVVLGSYADADLNQQLRQSASHYSRAFIEGYKCFPYMREAE